MKLSEIIPILQNSLETYGDVPVFIHQIYNEDGTDSTLVEAIDTPVFCTGKNVVRLCDYVD